MLEIEFKSVSDQITNVTGGITFQNKKLIQCLKHRIL